MTDKEATKHISYNLNQEQIQVWKYFNSRILAYMSNQNYIFICGSFRLKFKFIYASLQ